MDKQDWTLPPYTIQEVLVAQTQIIDWGLRSLGVPDCWSLSTGKGIRVAVLDTGAPDHPDLTGAVEAAKDFTGSRYGARDIQGHGTHCAGIIAARNNEAGVVGVAPNASLFCGKVLGDSGSGSNQSVAAGIRWAVEMKSHVISMSLGSSSPDPLIHREIIAAKEAGVVVVCAMGNDGPGANTGNYPGKWPEVCGVASSNEQNQISSYSSRGQEVDIAAPGENVTSTYLNGTVARLSGTSMATPFVAGVVALFLSRFAPLSIDPRVVIDLIEKTAKDIDRAGFDPNSGYGLINPVALLASTLPGEPPATPRKLVATINVYDDGTVVKA